MWPVRVLRDLRSRRKHREAPKNFPIAATIQGKEVEVSIPAKRYPILLSFPIFAEPGYFHPETYQQAITVQDATTISFGPKPEDVAKELGATELRLTQEHQPVAFARMLAKIGYAHAFSLGATKMLDGRSPVIDSILGVTQDIGMWVGTVADAPPSRPGMLHNLQIIENHEAKLLIATVRLFSDSATPIYGVILGSLKCAA